MTDNATARRLASRLRQHLQGDVRFDMGSRALYATDGSLYRQVPIGVVVPRSVDEVEFTVSLCQEADVPVLPRGAGTSLAGQCCNTAVILDFSKYLNRIIDIDPERRLARVQPGCVLDDLRNATERHHLTFGPDPSTHSHNTLGGMIGNNSCGVHSLMSGRTADNVHALDVLTYDGTRLRVGETPPAELAQIIAGGGRRGQLYQGMGAIRDHYQTAIREHYPDIPRRVSGYNLDQLLPENNFHVARALVGSEGTCALALEAELHLVHSPPHRCLLVLGYPSVYESTDHIMEIREFGAIGLEGVDHVLMSQMHEKNMHSQTRRQLPDGNGWLLLEFGADTPSDARAKAGALIQHLGQQSHPPSHLLVEDEARQLAFWKLREAGLGASSRNHSLGPSHPGWEDAAVPPERLGDYLRQFRKLLHRHGYEAALYGHFGDGCVHCRINFDLSSPAGLNNWHAFMREAADLVVNHGGSLSGEHGDGQVRGELLPRMFGADVMDAMAGFKHLWDPRNRMNPGKVVEPYPIKANLREGPGTRILPVKTEFDFSADHHSYLGAVNRCVGIGNCRKESGGVMCPSYRATGDEQHSTRGRSRLLFEMLNGRAITDHWRSDAVADALDLCLSCKGCKHDCPVGVDMATLKSEFMSHHYKGRLRPRVAYSMGLIWWWSQIARHLPGLANFMLRNTVLAPLTKWIAGIARQREMPAYAHTDFRRWFRHHHPAHPGAPRVILWPDTFNNHFYPQTLQAAVRVLEAAGYQVITPAKALCCARPLYADGMLKLARRQLGSILDSLTPLIAERLPLVGVEPSCIASFCDELPGLFPHDERAHYLASNTFTLGHFLHQQGWQPPRMTGQALVHMHCHQHGSLDTSGDMQMLKAMGLQAELLDAGCCGMAGPFGFDARHYEISQRIGEHQLLPALRAAAPDTLLIANGFSCREQIRQSIGRSTLSIAEVLDLAVAKGDWRAQPIY